MITKEDKEVIKRGNSLFSLECEILSLKKGDELMYCPKCFIDYGKNNFGPSKCHCGESMRIVKQDIKVGIKNV